MRHMGKPLSVLGFLFVVLILNSRSITSSSELDDESGFDYKLLSDKGPEHWGEINENWTDCKKGQMQSPIDLLNRRVELVPKLGKLKRSYKPSNALLENRGHDICLKWPAGAGYIQINGTDYELEQCHWHSPSEHTINGERFDLELHMVHSYKGSDSSVIYHTAVVGILYKIHLYHTDHPDTFLSELKEKIQSISDSRKNISVGVVDPKDIKIGGRKYYRYIGSLTIPPCTENVIWSISKRVRSVLKEQVDGLKKAVHDGEENNYRPSQPLNGRKIQLYEPRKASHQCIN